MSGTTVAPAARTPQTGLSARVGRLVAWRSPVGLVITITTVLALVLRLYQFARPGYLLGLTEYDDGSYFGSAVHLTDGVMPYRDFVFVQPPGITLLMAPAALAAKAIGTGWGMAIGRILTALASAAGVTVLGLLVRHRGVLATLIACGLLAVFPDSIAASHTVLVEAWLTLFCLLGTLAVFDRDGFAGNARMLWGGVAFGFAGAIEAWAIVPVAVVFVLNLRRVGRGLLYAAGVGAGFLIPVVPFALLSPRGFYQSLIVAQIGPRASATRVAMWIRFREMTGLSDLSPVGHANFVLARFHLPQFPVVVITSAVVVILVYAGFAAAWLFRRVPGPLDWFAMVATTGIAAMFLWPSQFHYHFSAFLAPFLALAIGLPVARLAGPSSPATAVRPAESQPADRSTGGAADGGQRALGKDQQSAGAAQAGQPGSAGNAATGRPGTGGAVQTAVMLVAGLALFAFTVIQGGAESRLGPYVSPAKINAVGKRIPPGACVATDSASLLVLSNRLVSNVPGCSQMLDGLGTDLALSGGLKPSTGAGSVLAVAQVWQQAFAHAQYVWLTSKNGRRIAWTPELRAYFASRFVQVPIVSGADTLYVRRARAGG